MAHHWRPSDNLEPGYQSSEWILSDRANRVGTIQFGNVRRRPAFRAVARNGSLVGYAWTLEAACDRLWGWWIRSKKGAQLSAWPWSPIQISEFEWVIMRNSPTQPKGLVRRFDADSQHPTFFRAVTWAPTSEGRQLIGYFPTLEAADEAVLEDPYRDIRDGPDKDRLGASG
ncbi:MAG: hypothetical protein JWP85_519 [Rhodoglobus sp.]|nr:hypothetical protein [Rhodoglobus sp.]